MSTQTPQTQTPQEGGTPKIPQVGFFVIGNYKYKYALPSVHAIDCVKYISRSGLTFQGCLKFRIEGGVITTEDLQGGLYGSFIEPLISLETRRKMSRNIVELKSYAVKLVSELKELGLNNKELLVYYDNNKIIVYDKFIKAKDVTLRPQNLVLVNNYGSYRVEVYKLDYTLSVDDLEDYLTSTIEHPLRIVTDKKALIELWTPWRQSYEAVLLINNDSTKLTIEDESGVLTSPGLYLILIH